MLGFLGSPLPTIKGCHHNHHFLPPSRKFIPTVGLITVSETGYPPTVTVCLSKRAAWRIWTVNWMSKTASKELCRSTSVTRDLTKKSPEEVPEIEPGWFVNRRVKKLGAGRSPHWAGHAPDQRLDPKRAHRSRSAQSHHRRHWPVRD